MKLCAFASDAGPRLGALLADGTVLDLAAAERSLGRPSDGAFASMQALIDAGEPGLDAAAALVAVAPAEALVDPAPRLLAPLPVPAQMRDCLSFETHLVNAFAAVLKLNARNEPDPEAAEARLRATGRFDVPKVWYQQPIYYKANRFAVAGPEDDVVWPAYSDLMDFELEMACVIGRRGRDIAREDADAHIFGYTILNDYSARDAQAAEQMGMLGPAKGKDFDGSNILGPVIVTRDELPDPYGLRMVARVNGEVWCDGSSATMHWRFPDMIAHISRGETLHPGEVIGSGTVGWGCGLEHLRFLQAGDVVELEIEGIGRLRNRVVRAAAPGGAA